MFFVNTQLQYFQEKASVLADTYENQIRGLTVLGDYLTEDIANDWMLDDMKDLEKLVKGKLVSPKVIDLYIQIDNNFASVSRKGDLFDKDIWTLKGLQAHPFWSTQRKLAQEFLEQLVLKA